MALSILQEWMKIWWKDLSGIERYNVRCLILNLIAGPRGESVSKALRTKIAVLLASVGLKQFPHDWVSLVEELIKLWEQSGTKQQEIVLCSLDFIIIDCIDNDFNSSITTLKKQEIINALKEKQLLILTTLFNFINLCIIKYDQYSKEKGIFVMNKLFYLDL
jgi:hypothetical protein